LVLCVFLGLTGLLRSQAPAEKPAPSSAAKSPEQLIEQLGDQDYRARDAAGKSLESLGSRALPALRKAREHEDPEVRRRVATLLRTLENAALLAPKRVTVNLTRKPIRQVMDELAKQTGYKIEMWGGNDQGMCDLKCENLPFWQAFDRVARAGGLVLQIGYGDDHLRVNQQDSYVPYIAYDGSFRVVANSFHYNKTVDFSALPRTAGGANRYENMSFGLTVCSEPKLPLMSLGQPQLSVAVDNDGRSMLPSPAGGMDGRFIGGRMAYYGGGNRTCAMQTQAALVRPSEKSRSVKLIKGAVPVTLLADQKPKVVADNILKAKGKKAQIGTTSFVIDDVTVSPNKQYQIKMEVTEDNKDNPNDFTWMNSLYNRIELQDAKGNKFQVQGTSWGNSAPNHVQMTLTYGNPGNAGAPTKLIYAVWTLVHSEVKFEFKDLPLP
jgi:hypothetical protein